MSTPSALIYEKEHAASEKYNYFICTVAGALFAYIAKDYIPHKICAWIDWLMPSALAALTISFACGLTQLRFFISVTKMNKGIASNTETVKNMTEWLLKNQGAEKSVSPVNLHTAEKFTHTEFSGHRDDLVKRVSKDAKTMQRRNSLGGIFGVLCHVFLFAGFILIVVAKFASPYLIK